MAQILIGISLYNILPAFEFQVLEKCSISFKHESEIKSVSNYDKARLEHQPLVSSIPYILDGWYNWGVDKFLCNQSYCWHSVLKVVCHNDGEKLLAGLVLGGLNDAEDSIESFLYVLPRRCFWRNQFAVRFSQNFSKLDFCQLILINKLMVVLNTYSRQVESLCNICGIENAVKGIMHQQMRVGL